jgi:hypothetical protein
MVQPTSKDLQRVKAVFFMGAAINLIGAFQVYRLMSGIEQLWGVYADTSGLAFVLCIDLAIAAVLIYAAVQTGNGQIKFAKAGAIILTVMSILGLLLGGMADGFIFVLDLACLAGGIWAWIQVRRAEQTMAVAT